MTGCREGGCPTSAGENVAAVPGPGAGDRCPVVRRHQLHPQS